MSEGYLYVLEHPALLGWSKFGQTIKHPEQRLKQHQYTGLLGRIRKATGQHWRLCHYVPVTDARLAESYLREYFAHVGRVELTSMPAAEMAALITMHSAVPFIDQERYQEMLADELKAYPLEALEQTNQQRTIWSIERWLDELERQQRQSQKNIFE